MRKLVELVWLVVVLGSGARADVTRQKVKPGGGKPAVTNAPAKAARASSAWDGSYQLIPPVHGGLCPRPEGLGALKVASGKLSLPWNVDDWRTYASKPLRVGRIDGVAHADGTVAATSTFDAAILQSTAVGTAELKGQLESAGVAMTFSRDNDGTRLLALEVTLPNGRTCNVRWEKIGRPSPKPVPPPSDDDRRDAERRKQEDAERDRQRREDDQRRDRRQRCKASCGERSTTCYSRCDEQHHACYYDTCRSATTSDCTDRCGDVHRSCQRECFGDRNQCESDCDKL